MHQAQAHVNYAHPGASPSEYSGATNAGTEQLTVSRHVSVTFSTHFCKAIPFQFRMVGGFFICGLLLHARVFACRAVTPYFLELETESAFFAKFAVQR